MVPSSDLCNPLETRKENRWLYYEYYLGDKDQENRRNGDGENHWTGAESIEWYNGRFTRDTMHGPGEYRWRYRGAPGLFLTYEGSFYVNRMHGYGAMSYPDGKVFTGIFNNDVRYGPGIESFADRHQNVGLWCGTKLVRLAWCPETPSVVPVLHAGPNGRAFVEPHRIVLNTTFQTIGKSNKAVELLKECGSDPVAAAENWTKLYPKYCTDTASQLCQVELFQNDYYHGRIYSLKEQDSNLDNNEEIEQESQDNFEDVGPYYAWNNDEMIMDMMKHCFKHERQRRSTKLDLTTILSGPRTKFRRAARHELDSRTLLMASYLGHVASVTFLVNERWVDPNIADMQGNSAVMYATCGDQADIINFLVEAGANVDSYNDSCCTALGIALMRYTCAQGDIPISGIVQSMLPPPTPSNPVIQKRAFEWNINRDLQPPPLNALSNAAKSTSKLLKGSTEKSNTKHEKSITSLEETSNSKKRLEVPKAVDEIGKSVESMIVENKLYKDINDEYIVKVYDLFLQLNKSPTYLFDVHDMIKDIHDDILKEKTPEKNPKKQVSKELRETNKPSKEAMWQNFEKGDADDALLTSSEKLKTEMLEQIKSTISKLLDKGANPNLVRCPQCALFVAIVSGCADLMRLLLEHGANANESFPELFNYTILDIAVSQPMTVDNLEIIRILLENGAQADHRLHYEDLPPPHSTEPLQPIPGPTLLHTVLARKVDNEFEEDIRMQVLELLLEYNSDPLAQFKGRSAFDVATKNTDLLDVFIRSPTTNLNAVINESNQTILVKMFSMPYFKTIESKNRLQTLTNLLLFGADPFSECQNGDVLYKNLFVFVKKILLDLEGMQAPKQMPTAIPGKTDKAQKETKKEPKKESKKESKKELKKEDKSLGNIKQPAGKTASDDIGNLKQATDLTSDCARLMHIRWLQAKLTKELIRVIDKYKHRHWHMILPEHRNKRQAGLWLTTQRCLEIWDLLKTTNRNIYTDKRTLKLLLCTVHFFFLRSDSFNGFSPVKAIERNLIEYEINHMLNEHKKAILFSPKILPLQRLYVQPELFFHADSKFKVCFECFLPLEEECIGCKLCKLVSFCNMECMRLNIDRANCHPCSDYLKNKYFPSPSINDEPVEPIT